MSIYFFLLEYDRRDKPSVLITSPGSPDLYSTKRQHQTNRFLNRLTPGSTTNPSSYTHDVSSIGGKLQIKLGFEPGSLQLIVTIICSTELRPRQNGALRNPYAKVFLLPDRCDKSKRRTKTLADTNEPRWGQTFLFNGLRRSDLNNRYLEV